jgi:hypothetical protein
MERRLGRHIVERFHRALPDAHICIEGRPTWLETINEMQKMLDDCPTPQHQAAPSGTRHERQNAHHGLQGRIAQTSTAREGELSAADTSNQLAGQPSPRAATVI